MGREDFGREQREEKRMKVGDLVKSVIDDPDAHTQRPFVVSYWRTNWIKLLGFPAHWHRIEDWKVINESG